MPDFILILAVIGVGLAGFSIASRPRTPKTRHPTFASTTPPLHTLSPDQSHHDERRNDYLVRLNKWLDQLSDQERDEFEKNAAVKLSDYQKRVTTPEPTK